MPAAKPGVPRMPLPTTATMAILGWPEMLVDIAALQFDLELCCKASITVSAEAFRHDKTDALLAAALADHQHIGAHVLPRC